MEKTSLLKVNKKKYMVRKYTLPVYNRNLHLFIGSMSDLDKYVKEKYCITYANSNGEGSYYEGDGTRPHIIRISDFNWYIDEQVTLTHELLHFVFHALGECGIGLSTESEEAYTYALTEIQEQV